MNLLEDMHRRFSARGMAGLTNEEVGLLLRAALVLLDECGPSREGVIAALTAPAPAPLPEQSIAEYLDGLRVFERDSRESKLVVGAAPQPEPQRCSTLLCGKPAVWKHPTLNLQKCDGCRDRWTGPQPPSDWVRIEPGPKPVVKESLTTEPQPQEVCEWKHYPAFPADPWLTGCGWWKTMVAGQKTRNCGRPIREVRA